MSHFPGVTDIAATVADYSHRLGGPPTVMVPGEYALWRTATPNFAIRPVMPAQAGQLRHLGSADPDCRQFAISVDVNGVTWEHFSADQQAWEIAATWPGASRVAGD